MRAMTCVFPSRYPSFSVNIQKSPPKYPLVGDFLAYIIQYLYLCIGFENQPTMNRKQILKIIVSVLIAALTALGAAIGLNSCNVVRTITNKSEYYQRGDTSVMIQTKTTESYDATKK